MQKITNSTDLKKIQFIRGVFPDVTLNQESLENICINDLMELILSTTNIEEALYLAEEFNKRFHGETK